MVFEQRAIVGQHEATADEPPQVVRAGRVPRSKHVELRQADFVQRRCRTRVATFRDKQLLAQPEWLRAADHEVAVEPQRGMREHVEKRPHDQSILRLWPMPNPLLGQPVLAQRVSYEREVLARIHIPGAGVNRLNDIGRNHVERLSRQE